mgnify:CR=1 FL=1
MSYEQLAMNFPGIPYRGVSFLSPAVVFVTPWIVPVKRLILSGKTGSWCTLPYPGHPKGCPNYGKKPSCPPNAPPVRERFDLARPLYLVHSGFDLAAHAAAMKEKHSGWSDRQCRCLLYWQPKSRKQLRERVLRAAAITGAREMTDCPEAMGVNVFATAAVSGLKLDRTRSISICRHVALLGFRRGKENR